MTLSREKLKLLKLTRPVRAHLERKIDRRAKRGVRAEPWLDPRRTAQIAPEGDWRVWLVMAGRGFGKTFTGAHWLHDRVLAGARRLIAVAPTAADVRDIIVDGESGVLATARARGIAVQYEPSKRRLTWSESGATCVLVSADEPERARGLQADTIWFDEIGAARLAVDMWDNLMFGLRLGDDPRALATTTPRPTPLIRRLVTDPLTALTRGATLENAANLAEAFVTQITARYAGTRLGRQELDGELLLDTPGALWTLSMLERDGFRLEVAPAMRRVVIGVDPNASNNDNSDEMGIIAAGIDARGDLIVLGDYTLRGTPQQRGAAVVNAFHNHKADSVVIEVNNGGDWIPASIHAIDRSIGIRSVHASRGKLTRAEPIALRYEQGKARHVGNLALLENELVTWTPGDTSPNRLDALVWAAWSLTQNMSTATAHAGRM